VSDIQLCRNELTSRGTCNQMMRVVRVPSGRMILQCLRCAWREAGQCWQCGGKRTNDLERGVLCQVCADASLQAANAAARHTPEAIAKRKAYDHARYVARKQRKIIEATNEQP